MNALADSFIAVLNGVMHLFGVLPVPVTASLVGGAFAFASLAAADIEDLARNQRKPEVPLH